MGRGIEELLGETRVSDLPRGTVVSVAPSTPLREVYRLLDEERPGAVLVVAGDNPVGIFTERDVLYRTALEAVDPATPIEQLMTRGTVSVPAASHVPAAVSVMVERSCRQLPLLDEAGRATGMVRSRDVIRFIADHFPETFMNLPPRLRQEMPRPEGG